MLGTSVVKVMKKEESCLTVEELVIGSGKGCLAGAVGTAAGSAVSATGIYAATLAAGCVAGAASTAMSMVLEREWCEEPYKTRFVPQ
jgi:hypothetical protein